MDATNCSNYVYVSQFDEIGSSSTQGKAPYVGMKFKTSKEARAYYEDYGRENGFWIRTRTAVKSRPRINEVTFIKFVCSHEGKYYSRKLAGVSCEIENYQQEGSTKRRSCSTVRGGCNANMRISNDIEGGYWIVKAFEDDHNHKFVSPLKRIKMKSNRSMPELAKNLSEAFRNENIKVAKVVSILGGDTIGFNGRDCYNHLRCIRRKELEVGDAQSVLTFFQKKQAENPQFYYAIQCDEDGRATNFFWVDAMCRMSYQCFGDVVTFDTTYRTNKYDMPFAPFTGVNHHSQSIQFGCALLQDETEVTFSWLFQTWLDAMGGCYPMCIITDQDQAMKAAITKVLPHTHHRLCLWHIMKKFGEKLSHIYYKKSNFKKDVKSCIHFTYKVEVFEKKWKEMIVEYGLESNKWLQDLYVIRDSSVPVYNRGLFFAGMNTTGRSESINSFFDSFVTSRTNLHEFVLKYDQALASIVKRENDEDFESEHKYRIVNDDNLLLKHASKVYTRNIFEKFKEEWMKVKDYRVEEVNYDCVTYIIQHREREFEKFQVGYNLQNHEGKCECQHFEFVGIICSHILKVLIREDIDVLPSHFIKKRWMQGANKFRSTESEKIVNKDDEQHTKALRLGHMCRIATQLACHAAESNEGYQLYIKAIEVVREQIYRVDIGTYLPVETSSNLLDNCNEDRSQFVLSNPNISITKGRKKDEKCKGKNNLTSERFKSSIELAQKNKNRRCALCKELGHDKRICPKNPKKNVNGSNEQMD